jgi:hypothetical protein
MPPQAASDRQSERDHARDVVAGGRLELGVQRAFGCELASPGLDYKAWGC